jgi:transcription termination/antitermination protein NusA
LRGEKIDIIPYNDEPARFVAKALSPARVREVLVDDDTKEATVIVPDDQLSLAIGREGQNARLAAKLTGWKVDIKSQTEFSESDEIEFEAESEEGDGRCAAVLSAGRRCPNAALPGSRYCGLPQHQALSRFGTNQVTVLSALNDDEIALLANPDADQGEITVLVQRAEQAHGGGEPEDAEPEAEAKAEPEEAPAEEAEAPASEEPAAEAEEETPEEEPEPAEAEEPVEEEPAAEEAEAEESADTEPAEEPTEAQA